MTDDLVKRLRNNCSCNFSSTPCGAEEECRNAFEGADRIVKLEEALRRIAEFDIDRSVSKHWRDDKQPSKNDMCIHDVTMYDECSFCIANFAGKELE